MLIAAQGRQFIYNIMDPLSTQPLNDHPLSWTTRIQAVAHASKAAETLDVSQQNEAGRIRPNLHQSSSDSEG